MSYIDDNDLSTNKKNPCLVCRSNLKWPTSHNEFGIITNVPAEMDKFFLFSKITDVEFVVDTCSESALSSWLSKQSE